MAVMKIVLALILAAVIAAFAVAADSPFLAERNLIGVNLSAQIKLDAASPGFSVEYVNANVSFVPSDTESQKVLSMGTSPEAETGNGVMQFSWQSPQPGELAAMMNMTVEVKPWQPKVREKVAFPIRELDPALLPYTTPSENIDSDNPDIVRLASQLAEGEDDLYMVAFRAANWTQQNIEYNLSTLTADVSQKASWVLKNRQGVCDELTNLFIAMMRSLGLPARFVSGVAYTDSPLFPDNWGPHGWAEVYFPGYGWVPFDTTYGEFGYIDAGHVKASDSVDSSQAVELSASAYGRGFSIRTDEINIKPGIISSDGVVKPQTDMSASVAEDEVGFGSYNLVKLSLRNLKDYYVAVEVIAGKTKGLDIDGPVRHVLLRPGEEKIEYFYIKVDDELDKRFIYTFPIGFYATRNATSFTSFSAGTRAEVFNKGYFDRLVVRKEESKETASSLIFSCSPDKKQYYTYETANISCYAKNSGNKFISGLSACLVGCDVFDLGISQSKNSSFTYGFSKTGSQSIIIAASGEDVSGSALLKLNVLDVPEVEISGISYPASVSYNEAFNVSFVAEKKSVSVPVKVAAAAGSERLDAEALNKSSTFVFSFTGRELKEGLNKMQINVKYGDLNGRAYEKSTEISITLKKLTLWQRIQLLLRRFFGF
ncbi:transglutaminase domain-containing protein [Candidatus Woesearchaeota archaeon]|nr:transglutaminase domain-containing protein [Candidatus Woesearchaeota archaeon]